MKKISFVLFFVSFIILCSWTITVPSLRIQNPWNVRIGKKEILNQDKNKMGDTVALSRNKLKDTDTLYAERNLLGFTAANSVVVLTVTNDKDEIIKDARNTSNILIFAAKLPMKELLASAGFVKGKTINIYFTIISRAEKLKERILMAVIKLK